MFWNGTITKLKTFNTVLRVAYGRFSIHNHCNYRHHGCGRHGNDTFCRMVASGPQLGVDVTRTRTTLNSGVESTITDCLSSYKAL